MKQALVFTYGKTKKHAKKFRDSLKYEMKELGIEENDYFYFTEQVTKLQFLSEVNDLLEENIDCIFINDYTEMLINENEISDLVLELQNIGLEIYDELEGNLTQKFTSVIKVNDEEERKRKSKETFDKRSINVKQGKWTGGKVPFGYKLTIFKKLFVKEDESKVVKEMFKYYSYGCRLGTVSRLIGDIYGCKYENSYWKARKIYDILINPIYIGRYSFNKNKIVNGKQVAMPREEWHISEEKIEELSIIDEDLFNRVQGMLLKDEDKPAYHKKN